MHKCSLACQLHEGIRTCTGNPAPHLRSRTACMHASAPRPQAAHNGDTLRKTLNHLSTGSPGERRPRPAAKSRSTRYVPAFAGSGCSGLLPDADALQCLTVPAARAVLQDREGRPPLHRHNEPPEPAERAPRAPHAEAVKRRRSRGRAPPEPRGPLTPRQGPRVHGEQHRRGGPWRIAAAGRRTHTTWYSRRLSEEVLLRAEPERTLAWAHCLNTRWKSKRLEDARSWRSTTAGRPLAARWWWPARCRGRRILQGF
eukprot:SAG22_NODE_232_length_14402_cov_58.042159_9_plen_256_part_00